LIVLGKKGDGTAKDAKSAKGIREELNHDGTTGTTLK